VQRLAIRWRQGRAVVYVDDGDLSLPALKLQMQFASDKNFEHAHRCYDQALQMNPDSVRLHLLPVHSVLRSIICMQIAAWLCKARALLAASTFDDAIQALPCHFYYHIL
jgi:hypothetical protein